MFIRSLFLHPDPPPAGAPPAIPPVDPARRATSMVDRLIARHGSAEAALAFVATQVVAHEDTIAGHERTIGELRAKVPAEGSVVLPKAEAAQLARLKELGTPDEIVAGMTERGELKAQATAFALEKMAREAAGLAGLDPDAFAEHAAGKGLHIEFRDVQVTEHGKTVTRKAPQVRPSADPKAPLTPLTDYTGTLPAYEQRALKPGTAPATGQPYPEQGPTPSGAGGGTDRVGSFIAKQAERAQARPNALIPARPAQPAGATP